MSKIWGIIPAAGCGTRIQPLAFSKELLPVGSFGIGTLERPRAISEYIIDRMITAGVTSICFVISPAKADIIKYYGNGIDSTFFCYTIQQQPTGLCSALFTPLPLINPDDNVIVGLPDTVWFPDDALCKLKYNQLSFLLFPVKNPELYDAVELNESGTVNKIFVKEKATEGLWIWGAISIPGKIYLDLYSLWNYRNRKDEFFGTLVNEYIERGGIAYGVKAGQAYVDVGTLNGYREAMKVLTELSIENIKYKPDICLK